MRGPMHPSYNNCVACGGRMKLVRIAPKAGPWQELRTFQCVDCDNVLTVKVERGSFGGPEVACEAPVT
jgi:hypothetical protein